MRLRSLCPEVLLCALVLVSSARVSNGGFIDDFEDGDRTANPIWTVTNPSGSDSVVADPFRADNFALEMVGTNTAHRILKTVSINQPAEGFRFVAEYAVSANAADFDLILGLSSSDGTFSIRTRLSAEQTPGESWWWIAKNPRRSPEWAVQDPDGTSFAKQPLGEWWRMILWNEPGTAIVNGEIRNVDDGSLIYERSYMLDAIPTGTISYGEIAIEELYPQYVDNFEVTTVPLPGAALLGALGIGMAGTWLRRQRP